MEKPFGFVVIDKPSGLTSHDCVNRLRKVFGIRKIGHSGTLDPAVTGVLPIAIGDATRLISYLQGSKAYTGIIQLGATTNTDDMQGEIIESKAWPLITQNDINYLLENFRGEILQKPPIFSSVHIKGERAYKKARKGEKFDLIPKKVTINKLNLISWSQNKGELLVDVDCSTGTYIRSLARDIGDKIGCGGYLKSLRRTKAYNFIENHSVKLPEKSDFYPEEDKPKVLNPNIFFKHLSSFELISEEEIISWRSGRKISFQNNIKRLKVSKNNEVEDSFIHNNNILVLNKENKILGIACLDESFAIKPKVVFNAIG
ncbi:Putative tRNA pseudouridine 55 synthase [Prochlorococcus marinus str. NATL1A]|uniref:tRNA pseudouridine synthase B n=1 Tax=Prochlorococcus marinus (strain NATL1A) TaxID=167555 RepID=TRUB_PROM1|nr:tRNA pseudouridine(55) synthase TruB [Prochlorococcus marinus]A2C4C0.1 RecName: Full=tRNA pseudouridine synthase B; AltName: Full=tRNA pseudouridine(55) synthase; Short=Psi55 synthase; AltName: Full=tRNA pseudouridylate synthase; AltName: Full=tRNA-uridine isomerase [Prochlorococcus marinus str. NATL1A]ABM76330.1 Putative tRNA pseudouridine 55 synthase [Prochlorococcus marinus str. NATL1A]